MKEKTRKKCGYFITHTFHVCYIYLHLVADFDAKCRFIFHTWMLWVIFLGKLHRDQFPPVEKTPSSTGRIVSPQKIPNNSGFGISGHLPINACYQFTSPIFPAFGNIINPNIELKNWWFASMFLLFLSGLFSGEPAVTLLGTKISHPSRHFWVDGFPNFHFDGICDHSQEGTNLGGLK